MKRMKARYRRMVQTRRLYDLETKLYDEPQFKVLSKQRSYRTLSKLVKNIWKNERVPFPLPTFAFGTGIVEGNHEYSWCSGDGSYIEMAPNSRDYLTVIHELVHAMGFGYHDEDFLTMHVYLLCKYTPVDTKLVSKTFEQLVS